MIKTETTVGLFILLALGIFFYMTFNIGVFRLDRNDYAPYTVYFHDIAGLQKKADVKIAGVKVGWVEKTELVQDHDMQAKACIMVLKRYELHSDAYGIVRQEGLLGTKYLELIPGNPLLPSLSSGSSLVSAGKQPVNVDELMHKFENIASNVESITGELRSVVGGEKEDLKDIIANFNHAAQHLASFSDALERTVVNNESNLNVIMSDFKEFSRSVKDGWPVVQQAMQDVSHQAAQGVKSIEKITDHLHEGKGFLGKLFTDETTFDDIKTSMKSVKTYLSKMDQLGFVFDMHSENMWGIAENFFDHTNNQVTKKDSKGYFGFRIHPNEDQFYIFQLVTTRKGWVERNLQFNRYSQFGGAVPGICPGELFVDPTLTPSAVVFQQPGCEERVTVHRAGIKINLQMAKVYKDLAFRFGLFDNTAGVGVDYNIPFKNDKLRWVTTLEAFDFYGDDRINDQRPHLKWLNSLFIMNNFYITFGADDFISRQNANAFMGIGLRFADDDLKYVMGKLGSLPPTAMPMIGG